ncbi:hypothetical protein [Bifidobacterium jacchi]|uniref:hypothetical protein n=1 Tax=Bifidobacterium jacchi TaxID=2490545 RepID=UPI001588280D|nr:hypothetical protein [Bifidobacterium jacchi]
MTDDEHSDAHADYVPSAARAWNRRPMMVRRPDIVNRCSRAVARLCRLLIGC